MPWLFFSSSVLGLVYYVWDDLRIALIRAVVRQQKHEGESE